MDNGDDYSIISVCLYDNVGEFKQLLEYWMGLKDKNEFCNKLLDNTVEYQDYYMMSEYHMLSVILKKNQIKPDYIDYVRTVNENFHFYHEQDVIECIEQIKQCLLYT